MNTLLTLLPLDVQKLEFSYQSDYNTVRELMKICDSNTQLRILNCIKNLLYNPTITNFDIQTIYIFRNLERLYIPIDISNDTNLDLLGLHPSLKWIIIKEDTREYCKDSAFLIRNEWIRQGKNIKDIYIRYIKYYSGNNMLKHGKKTLKSDRKTPYSTIDRVTLEIEGFELRLNLSPIRYKIEDSNINSVMGDFDNLRLRISKVKKYLWENGSMRTILDILDETTEEFYLLPRGNRINFIKYDVPDLIESIIHCDRNTTLKILECPFPINNENLIQSVQLLIEKFPNVDELHLLPTELLTTENILKLTDLISNKKFVLWIISKLSYKFSLIGLLKNIKLINFPYYRIEPNDQYNLNTRIGDRM